MSGVERFCRNTVNAGLTRFVGRVFLGILLFACFLANFVSAQTPAATANQGKFDGPAELPRVYVKSALEDTPAPGKKVAVKAGGNLQAALDDASCGDTLELEAGAVFSGHFILPKKACDDQHWIIIRTGAPDSALPPEGTRLTPCYAGVASLPGRPDFHCVSVKNVMAKLVAPGPGPAGPIFFGDGANHYRFIGIEFTREAPGIEIVALVQPKGAVPADHIFFDRVWMHGTPQDETRRGLFLSGTSYMAVVDSFFSDFHCTAKGSCVDSQTISGAAGDLPMGPYKIVNNFLEASGENILLGGASATSTPGDIEIRHNYFFKPMIWMRGQPGFVGGSSGEPFIVKNDFELKNAQRVLFEGNILEDSWGGFSQTGFSILITPKNPMGNLCPLCRVTDVTIRYCKISHVGSAFSIGNVPMGGHGPTAGERYSIHDLVIDDIDGKKFGGFGIFLALTSQSPPLKDVKMDHITATNSRVLMNMGIFGGKLQGFTFTNNLIGTNEKEVTTTGGGAENCVFQPDRQTPAGVLKNCFDGIVFSHNLIVNGSGPWPAGNSTTKDSKHSSVGADGKNVGADLERVDAETKGVI